MVFATRSRLPAQACSTFQPAIPFTPIENALSKLKALLRAKAERTIAALWGALGVILDRFTPDESANYFNAAGYQPD